MKEFMHFSDEVGEHFSVTKNGDHPSFKGRIAVILPGVRPSIRLASSPTAATLR